MVAMGICIIHRCCRTDQGVRADSGAPDPEETSVEFSTWRRSSDSFAVELLMELMCNCGI